MWQTSLKCVGLKQYWFMQPKILWTGNFDWAQLEGSDLSWAHWWPCWVRTSLRWPQLDSSSFDGCGLFPFNRLKSARHILREWPEACRVSWGSELAPHHCFHYKASSNSRGTCWIWRAENSHCQGAEIQRGENWGCFYNPLQIVSLLWGPPAPVAFFHRRQTLEKPLHLQPPRIWCYFIEPKNFHVTPISSTSKLVKKPRPCLKAFPCFNPICGTQ